MRVAILGVGYVGLVSGACLAELGHEVVCGDVDGARIGALQAGRMPIFEPGLAELVAAGREGGRLAFTADSTAAISGAEVIVVAVGTPPGPDDGADLRQVDAAAATIASAMTSGAVIAIKSTVPVGTGDRVSALIAGLRPDVAAHVVSNPEFLREGNAIADFMRPDRILVGADDEAAVRIMTTLYRPLTDAGAPLVFTSRRSAELAKYAANTLLATKLAFSNEMADLCEATGADIDEVMGAAGLDRRIGTAFMSAGPGFGGSCFPKDVNALIAQARSAGVAARLAAATIDANAARRPAMLARVADAVGGDLAGTAIGVLGLTFKPGTDDVRQSPAIDLVRDLLAAGARVSAHDPRGMPASRALLPAVRYGADAYDTATGADALVLATEWPDYAELDLTRLRTAMTTPVLIDLRRLYAPERLEAAGFVYRSIGRRS